MPASPAPNWYVRQDGTTTGPFTEAELKEDLPLMIGTGTEIRQGDSQWYPAAVVEKKFRQLEEQGVYLRRSGGRVEGPFTATRAIEMLRANPAGEVMVGKNGSWDLASVFLADAKVKADELPKVRAQCPHCRKTLSVPTTLVGNSVSCPSCSKSFRVPAADASAGKASSPSSVRSTRSTRSAPSTRKKPIVVSPDDIKVVRSEPVKPIAPTPASPTPASPTPASPAPVAPVSVVPAPVNPVPMAPVVNRPVTSVPVVPGATRPADDAFDADVFTPPPAAVRPISQPRFPANPYTSPSLSGGAQAGAYSGGQADRSVHYIIPGVFFLIWGILFCVGVLGNIVQIVIVVAAAMQGTSAEVQQLGARMATLGVIHVVQMLFAIALAYVFISGAIAMFQRRSHQLSSARVAAVCAAIPCLGCFIMPFGIWACVTLFSENARQDFRG